MMPSLKNHPLGFIVVGVLAATPLAWSTVKTKSLVAGYRLEETSGTSVSDLSGNGHTGTAHGTTIVAGHSGNARSFNGSSDYVSVPDVAALRLTVWSISAWVKITALPSSGSVAKILAKDDSGGNSNYAFGIDNADTCASKSWKFTFDDASGNNYDICYAATINTGTWYFIAGTWDGTTQKFYLNGVQVASQAPGHSPTTASGGDLELGNEYTNTFYFKGIIDEARIYSRALTASEVRSLMSGYEPGEF